MTSGSLFWTIVIAAIGGALVFVGLLLEQMAEKSWYENARDLKFSRRAKFTGEWLVIIGVGVEVVVGCNSAIIEWKNDPQKKPIASASAMARIIFKLENKPRSPLDSFFKPSENDTVGWNAGVTFESGSNTLLSLRTTSDVSTWNMGSEIERECRILFKENPLDFLETESDRNKILVKQFNDVDSVILYVSELQTNTEVVSGNVYLTVNNLKWSFAIPPQKTKWGLITMQKITNSAGITESKVRRLQIGDFVSPPRWTNLWYDGK